MVEWVVGWWVIRSEAVLLAVAVQACVLELLVLRAASVEGVEVAWKCVPAERLDTTGPGCGGAQNCPCWCCRSGGLYVDNLTINPRASQLRWSRFCINMRSQWEWHQRSLCMLVILSFGCNLAVINFRRDCRGIWNFRSKQLFWERSCGAGASAH